MLVNPQSKVIPAATFARVARERAANALAQSGTAADPDGWWPLDYHATLYGRFDGERMALDAARRGVGGDSLAAKRTQMALERGELRSILAARGRDLAAEAEAAGLAKGCRDASWRRGYVDRYVTAASANFALSCEESEVVALQARAEGLQAAAQYGLTGRDWLN